MGDKNPKNKAKDQKRKIDDKADAAKKAQAAKDAKSATAAKTKKQFVRSILNLRGSCINENKRVTKFLCRDFQEATQPSHAGLIFCNHHECGLIQFPPNQAEHCERHQLLGSFRPTLRASLQNLGSACFE